jgi:hypothetical protein
MNPTRESYLEASLRTHLLEATEEFSFDSGSRIRWLIDHVEEYIDRWVGFCDLPNSSMTSLMNGDFFGVVEIGLKVLGEELANIKMSPEAEATWKRYCIVVCEIRESHDRALIPQIVSGIQEMRNALE